MDMPISQQINNSADTSSVKITKPETESFWGKDGFTFGDVFDMFNPLQHLPFVAKYYREQTNDDACEGSKLIGGALFGGLFGGVGGVVSAIANSAIRHETHQDVSEHIIEVVDNSFDNIHTSKKFSQSISKTISKTMPEINVQAKAVSSEIINPFFAQILDEYSSEYSEFSSRKDLSAQRSRDWGKV